jgi:hypothetical protein
MVPKPTQQYVLDRLANRMAKQNLHSSDLSTSEINNILRQIYDPKKLSGPRFFYSQNKYGLLIAKIPNMGGNNIFCTVADTNSLSARDWEKEPKPTDFTGKAWPPTSLAHLTGNPELSDVCVGCDTTAKCACTRYIQSEHFRNFWIKHLLLRKVEGQGYGAFAREPIENGTAIGELAGKIVPRDTRENHYHTSISIGDVADTASTWIDLTRTGSVARFINHSCAPNCQFVEGRCGQAYRIVYVEAIRDIGKGEELLVDYGSKWLDDVGYPCLCSEPTCRNPPKAQIATNVNPSVPGRTV